MERHRRAKTPGSLLVSGLSVLLVACGGDAQAPGGPSSEVVDSAGTQIVSSYRALWDSTSAWRVGAEPRLSIGQIDGEEAATNFTLVRDGTLLSDGRIVVVDSDAREVRWFDPDGNHLLTRGGQGQGPGEFNYPRYLVRLAGDTVAVEDRPRVKFVRFSPDGEHVDDELLDFQRFLEVASGGCVDAVLPDLSLTGCRLIGERQQQLPPGHHRSFSRVLVTDLEVTSVAELGVLGAIEQWGVDHQDRTRFAVHPFHSRGFIAVGGNPFRIALASNPGYSIEMWTPQGVLERVIRRPNGRLAPTAEQVESANEQLAQYARDDEALAQKFRTEIPTPDSLPAVYGLFVDDKGATWVRRNPYFVPDDPAVHDVFDAQGRYLGEITLPGRLAVFEIGEDYLLGAYRGEMDVPFVQVYDLDRRQP